MSNGLCQYHICPINSPATSRKSMSFLQTIRYLILISLTAISDIGLNLFHQSSRVTKCIDMLSYLCCSISRGLITLNRECRDVEGFLEVTIAYDFLHVCSDSLPVVLTPNLFQHF